MESAPKLERKVDPPKEKKKASKASEASGSAAPPTEKEKDKKGKKEKATAVEQAKEIEAVPTAKAQKQEKKEKKEKKPNEEGASKKGGGGKAVPEDAGEPVPSMIDLRVGHIVDGDYRVPASDYSFSTASPVIKHPDADGLYVEVCLTH